MTLLPGAIRRAALGQHDDPGIRTMRSRNRDRFIARAASRGREQQNIGRCALQLVKSVFAGIGGRERETLVGQNLAKRVAAGVGRADQEKAGSFCGHG